MFWLAVRADGIGSGGVTVGWALPEGEPEAVPDELPSGAGVAAVTGDEAGPLTEGLADGLADGFAPNSDLLAGTSSRKDAKIWLSWGWVHSTLAVSVGTTSERG
jgi:hypothetical protein